MRNLAPLSEGVPAAEGWRFVAVSDPGLVQDLEQARAAYDLHEPGVQLRAGAYQRAHCIPRHPVPSPHAKALALAEAAIEAKIEELIVEGQIVFAGFPAGQLEGGPVPIPLATLAGRRPRGGRVSIRGVQFFDVKLFRAADLPVAEPELEVEVPPATPGRLAEVLAALFSEDRAWAIAGNRRLAELVIARDRRFEPRDGPAQRGRWSAGTLRQRIKEVRAEAKAMAGQENY